MRIWFDHATRTVITDPAQVIARLKHPSRTGVLTIHPCDPFTVSPLELPQALAAETGGRTAAAPGPHSHNN